jgi:SNF2-related domain/Helicase conserved C-terminal domain
MSQFSLSVDQQNFLVLYPTLSSDQQSILQCLSVIYDAVSRTNLMKCLNKVGLKNDNGKKFIVKDMTPRLTPLAELGLVEMSAQGVRCNLEIVELVSRQAVDDKSFESLALAVQKIISAKEAWSTTSWYNNYNQGVRDIRIAFYRGRNEAQLQKILYSVYDQFPHDFLDKHPYELLFLNPFDRDMLHTLSPGLLSDFIIPILSSAFFRVDRADDLLDFLSEYCQKRGVTEGELFDIQALLLISRGQIKKAHELVSAWSPSTGVSMSYRGWLAFLEGKTDESLQFYRQGLQLFKEESGKRKVVYANIAGFFYLLALLQSGSSENMQEALAYLPLIKKQKGHIAQTTCDDLEQVLLQAMGQRSKAEKKLHSFQSLGSYSDYFSLLMAHLTHCWQGKETPEGAEKSLGLLLEHAEKGGYYWLAKEAAALLLIYKFETDTNRSRYEKLKKLCPLPDLCTALKPKENWEQVLSALTDLHKSQESQVGAGGERLVWLLDYDEELGDCEIVPRLQKLSKKGKWTKGRAVALSTLYSQVNTLFYLSGQDKNVVASIQKTYASRYSYYGGSSSSYSFLQSQALPALIGHPHLFWHNNPSVRVELLKGSPELHVLKKKKGYEITLHPPLEEDKSYALIQESPTRLTFIPVTPEYSRVVDIIGSSITVPLQAKDKVLKALSSVAKVLTVQSDVGGGAADMKKVAADPRPHIHLLPYNNGLQVELLCKPFADGGSYYQPGSGGKIVLAEIDGKQLQTARDLELEQQNTDQIIQECQTLQHHENLGNEWIFEEPEECLELLCELRELDDKAVLEWPKGETLKVTPEASFAQFSMGIKRDNDWFGATGTFKVDDELTLNMKKLLAMSLNSQSRFIKLDDGRFLTLSKAFKRRLEDLRAYSENHGQGVRFSPLAGLALEEFTEEIGSCKADIHWKNNLKRFQNISDPELPSTLQAKLRDYQLAGFKWLGCLSFWQVGGCLADDMGLGKTVQALAVILLRAPDGPTMVVAPTSVMMNWQDEATRFAPTLNVQLFADGDREKRLSHLGAFDLLICSYGLLQSEGAMLAGVEWQTVVLDEAQAIKNMQTKRSQAAMNLQASFKVITTGTPIENHLGELWNLFRFINPGLLGSHESFKKKFANPIEKQKDRTAATRLRKLIQPFILRRLKQDVLQELPPRTEVTMQVEMSAEEQAMYEVQRQKALETVAEGKMEKGGQQHLQILAEITRLRRFCCNPQLVVPDLGIASSKLKVFTQIVQELLENGHKALVFSQFVGHLTLIRKRLDELDISYQYLDGSTSTKQRTKRVKDFQAGKSDLFLISLRAGGAGINLTAADYVIHMDPWWNPAVEDQASDRAHRIGQRRPVTVYRLVVKGSIEEKIVAMHKNKRDLADNLLDGSDMSGKVSTAELLQLLKDG